MCSECFSGNKKRPGRYIMKMLTMINLRDAGYPMNPNLLTIDEWLDMKLIKDEIHSIQNQIKK